MSQYISAKPGEWDGEQRPLFLAPMAGVTDLPFRLLAKDCGADFTITEFTNSTALTREAAMSWQRMETCEDESPFIPQISWLRLRQFASIPALSVCLVS